MQNQVKLINRTIINLLKLNVCDVINNWDLNIKLTLITYRNAMQASTGYTSYFLLTEQQIRLFCYVIFEPPVHERSQTKYLIDMFKTLHHAYDLVRDNLQLSHKRQTNYYNCRNRYKRFKH